jgi:hypothetical protein
MRTTNDSDRVQGQVAFENGLLMLIGQEFGGAASGFKVIWEARHFRPSRFGDVFLQQVNKQALGYEPKIAEIYFRGEYLCDVSEEMTPEQVKQTIEVALVNKISR